MPTKITSGDLQYHRGGKVSHRGSDHVVVAIHPNGKALLSNGDLVSKGHLQIQHERNLAQAKAPKLGAKTPGPLGRKESAVPKKTAGKEKVQTEMPNVVKGSHGEDLHITKVDQNGWIEAKKSGSTQSRIYHPESLKDPKTGNSMKHIVDNREAAGVKTRGTGPDEWNRDERGRFASK